MELGHGIGIWADFVNSTIWCALGIFAWKLDQIPPSESSCVKSWPKILRPLPRKRSESRVALRPSSSRLPPVTLPASFPRGPAAAATATALPRRRRRHLVAPPPGSPSARSPSSKLRIPALLRAPRPRRSLVFLSPSHPPLPIPALLRASQLRRPLCALALTLVSTRFEG